METLLKPKFILNLAAIITAMLLAFIPFSVSAGTIADIVFENNPLFGETNLLPGDAVTKSVTVTNKVADNLAITTSAANIINTAGLGDRLNLTINKGSTNFYTGTMSAFFAAGTINLGTLAAGQTGVYEYTVSFDSTTGNSFQNKALSFDISVSAQAPETVNGLTSLSSGGSSGGYGYVLSSSAGDGSSDQPGGTGEPPAPEQRVLGEKITATADGNNLAETGFSAKELYVLLSIVAVLFALRILLKRYDKVS